MYLEFFGLKEKPFSLTPDPKFFFQSETHKTNLDLALYGIKAREGFLVITGAIGTGKTTICRTILGRMEKTHSALILNPFLSEEELLESILHDFGIMEKGAQKLTKQEMIDRLNQFLLDTSKAGENALIIIDEAQNLPLPVLEQIRILSNLETDKEKLLQIILVGQLGLLRLLKSPQLKQLDQRISVKCQLSPLKKEEVQRYIEYRLMVAGSAGGITFSPESLELIYEYSMGIPRLINLICDRALLGAYTLQSTSIEKETVEKAIENLKLEKKEQKMKMPGFTSFASSRVSMPVLIAGIVIAVTAIGFLIFQNIQGLRAKSAKRTLESRLRQLNLARQVEKSRLEEELKTLQKQVEELSAKASTPQPATSTPAVAIPPELRGVYTILIGAFKDKESAVQRTSGLKGVQQKAYVIASGKDYRLVLGQFKERNEAETVLQSLQTRGELAGAKVLTFSEAVITD
ncbi:MAG: AAA family ATPase [Candidatus Brocadiales bacterium]|nr:AAA family ATPase [Candidatus Brocadiales bacterium]